MALGHMSEESLRDLVRLKYIQQVSAGKLGPPDRPPYSPSDFCAECRAAGKKCNHCEGYKYLGKDVSISMFQEGPKKKRSKPSYICSIHCKYDVVRHVASKLGMKESIDNWNVLWSDFTVTCERLKNLKRYQKVNHFPGMIEICRKDLLARNLNRIHKIFPDDYDFFPRTWLLPTDYTEVLDYAKNNKNRTYILKPDLGCKGKGISLTKSLKQMSGMERTICQVYVAKPFLVDGYKFDLRVYALITSCDPLRIYVYNEGLARFATKFYEEPNRNNITNMYMHLTNYSVNKFSRTYKIDPEGGSKRKLGTLNETLRAEYHDVPRIWREVDDVIIKTVFLALPTLQHSYRAALPRQQNSKVCFEILGFDLILDENLKPYLLEVNHSPSFHTDAPIDREVKESLLIDTFRILDLPRNNKNKVIQEDRKKAANRLLKDLGTRDQWSKDIIEDDYSREDAIKKADAFELENIGNFRRIYPNDNSEKYNKFYSQGTSSLFHETLASRAREKATRLEMENHLAEKQGKADPPPLDTKNIPPKEKSFESFTQEMKKKEEERGEGKEGKPPTVVQPNFFANSPLEEKRINKFNEKQELLEKVRVLEKIHTTMKTFGAMKLKKDIKKVRKNKWSQQGDREKRFSLQSSLSDVIQHIDGTTQMANLFEPKLTWNTYYGRMHR